MTGSNSRARATDAPKDEEEEPMAEKLERVARPVLAKTDVYCQGLKGSVTVEGKKAPLTTALDRHCESTKKHHEEAR